MKIAESLVTLWSFDVVAARHDPMALMRSHPEEYEAAIRGLREVMSGTSKARHMRRLTNTSDLEICRESHQGYLWTVTHPSRSGSLHLEMLGGWSSRNE